MDRVVDVGEYIVSDNGDDVLKIYGLSSCIGLVMYCPVKKVLGVAHILLPSSDINPDLVKISPAYFADTAVKVLWETISEKALSSKERIIVGIYGGSESKSAKDVFNIGNRNIEAVKKNLAKYGLTINYSDVGGNCSRTLCAEVSTGNITVQTQKYITV